MTNIPSVDFTQSSWVPVPQGSGFPLQNLPLGIFSTNQTQPRVGVAIGEHIVDLGILYANGFLQGVSGLNPQVLASRSLNSLLGLGKATLRALRAELTILLESSNTSLQNHSTCCQQALISQQSAQLHLPVRAENYTDFYSSLEHASNVGSLFRDPQNPLLPNWKHLPVGYHGRASSIVVDGTPIRRPLGQRKPPNVENPIFGASTRMDFELEVAFVTCAETTLGRRLPVDNAEDYIAGFLLFNDWSARDIQAWEYVPLGPFLGKNFGSSISPWLVSLDALEPFRVEAVSQDPVLPYLAQSNRTSFDITLEAYLRTSNGVEQRLSETNFKYLYWTIAQQLAHHTVNGCNIAPGDLYASGTISGKSPSSYGSLLEISEGGKTPITLADGAQRTFLEDGDVLRLEGYAERNGVRIGLGSVSGEILPALPLA